MIPLETKMLKHKLYLLLASVLISSLARVEARPYWGNEDDGSINDTADSDYILPSNWAKQWDISITVESDGLEMLPPVFWAYDENETKSDHSNVRYNLWPWRTVDR